MKCQYCDREAELVTGEKTYPHLTSLHHIPFWFCQPCEAWVGCHPGTKTPLGSVANAELRLKRMQAHSAFDSTWTNRKERSKQYAWLADVMGLSEDKCHIGSFSEEQCQQVLDAVLLAELD